MTGFSEGLIWWVSVVELPALAGLLAMVWRVRGENGRAVDDLAHTLDLRCDQLREALHAFKLEVAKSYASRKDMGALESRIVDHLLRIEAKLDATALKAAEMQGKSHL